MLIDKANHICIAMPMYNFIEFSDNYSDSSGSLWQFKRDEPTVNNANLNVNNKDIFNSESFKYEAVLVGKTSDYANPNSFVKNTKIVVLLKYLRNFWRSLQVPLINCKIHLELNLIEDCILLNPADPEKLKITNAILHVTTVTLSTKDNVNLRKQLSDGFKRSIYWNSYQTVLAKVINQGSNIYELLSASFQVFERLFVLAYAIAAGTANNEAGIKDNRRYFLPRGEIKNYSVLTDGRNFYDQPINGLMKSGKYQQDKVMILL